MHGLRHTILSIALVAVAGPAAAADPPSSLPDLIRSALVTHEDVARADSSIRRAEADVKLARSALLPRLEFNGSFTRYESEVAFEISPGQQITIQPLSDWNWSADLQQTLFSGLRDWRARDAAHVRLDIAELERATARVDLALRVSQAFLDAFASEQQVQVRRTALDQNREQLRVAERRYEVGEVTSADVARWEARVAAERQSLIAARGTAELAGRRLARLCGIDAVGELQPPPPIIVPPGDTGEMHDLALETRLELRTLERQTRLGELLIDVERGAWLPQLDAHLQYYRQRSTFPDQGWMSLGLSLRVPIYDGGLTAARVAKAKEDLRQVGILRDETTKLVLDQVDAASVGLRTAEARLRAAEEGLQAARKAHRQTEKAYRVGEVGVTDLLTATTELTQARTSRIVARWERELQAIALRRAVGLDPVPGVKLIDVEPTTDSD